MSDKSKIYSRIKKSRIIEHVSQTHRFVEKEGDLLRKYAIYSSQGSRQILETTWMFLNRIVDKDNVAHFHSGYYSERDGGGARSCL